MMRIMIVQHAGDFREAHQRLTDTGTETYYGHRYVLEQLALFRRTFGEVAIMCCLSLERYDEVLPNGVTVIGAKAHPKKNAAEVLRVIEAWNPTHLIVLGPLTAVIRWGLKTDRQVMCQFADSFDIHPLIRLHRYGRLRSLLNDRRISWIANHGINACRSLVRMGVRSSKLIAWDWPYSRRPEDTSPRTGPPVNSVGLLYVGTLQPQKGVGDLIEAVAELRRRGSPVRLKIVGGGDASPFVAQAQAAGAAGDVEFAGRVANDEVFELMKRAIAVVVPSRHDYPEGLPLAIYEALCARTPVIASDHPMFAGNLVHRETAMIFPERDARALADRVFELLKEPDLYARLSEKGKPAWERLQNPAKWGDTLLHWLRNQPEDLRWLREHSFDAVEALSARTAPPGPGMRGNEERLP